MRRPLAIASSILVALLLAIVLSLAVRSALSSRPSNLGALQGRLAPCPNTPNCVSTRAADAEHRIEPIHFEGTQDEALTRLATIIRAMPRAQIVTESPGYLHAEFTSRLFRFVDDVELLVDGPGKTIHFRSASRTGYSDLGVNRRRMEAIRQAFDRSEVPQP